MAPKALGKMTPVLPTPTVESRGTLRQPKPLSKPRQGTPLLPTPRVQKRSYGKLALLR